MAFKIKANTAFTVRFLQVTSKGVVFQETAALGGKRRFTFDQIDAILMNPGNVLSFQVGNEVFSIPTRPDKKAHQAAIDELLQQVRHAGQGAAEGPGSTVP